MLLSEAFSYPDGELVLLDDDGMSIQSPQRDSQIPALPLPPQIRALYPSAKNHLKEEFISKLIYMTKDNKSLLDQIRNYLNKIAKDLSGFPEGSFFKREITFMRKS